MAMPERSDTEDRDYSRPATWGDVEHVRLSMETRLTTEIAEVKEQVGDVQVQVAKLEAKVEVDVARLEAETKADFARLEAQMKVDRAEAKAENAKTRADLTRLIVIGGGIGVGILGGLMGILQAFA